MAVEKACAACNGVMLGSAMHVCGGECDKPVHSVILCERVMNRLDESLVSETIYLW